MAADLAALLDYAVPALLAGCIVAEYFQRHLAGVEACSAGLSRFLFIFAADFKLEAAALEILVKSLKGLNHFAHGYFLPFC